MSGILGLALAVVSLPGCTLLHRLGEKRRAAAEKEAVPTPGVPQFVGTIVLVSAERGFVLIDNGSRPSPAIGAVLQSRPLREGLAELRVTEIRKRPFIIADIVRGEPLKGDRAFQ